MEGDLVHKCAGTQVWSEIEKCRQLIYSNKIKSREYSTGIDSVIDLAGIVQMLPSDCYYFLSGRGNKVINQSHDSETSKDE